MHYVYRGAGGDWRFVRCGGAEGATARAVAAALYSRIDLELTPPLLLLCVLLLLVLCSNFFDAWGRGSEACEAIGFAGVLIQLKSDNGYLSVH